MHEGRRNRLRPFLNPLQSVAVKWDFLRNHKSFAQALEQGTIIWKTIDFDKPKNSHFVRDYQVSTQSLIIVEMTGKKQQRYENLAKVWEYLPDLQAFYEYVTKEVNKFLTGS